MDYPARAATMRPLGARLLSAAAHLTLVYVLVRAFWWLSAGPHGPESIAVEMLLKLAAWVVPCVLLLMTVGRQTPRAAVRELRLGGSPAGAMAFATAATLPMALAILITPIGRFDFDLLLHSVVIGPFAEEVLFRGYLCWQLVARGHWPPWWAIGASALMFGVAHLEDVDNWLAVAGIALSVARAHVIGGEAAAPQVELVALYGAAAFRDALVAFSYAFGGLLFGWLLIRWRSLWPVIALHGAMNFWWSITTGDNAQMTVDLSPMSIAHALSIVAAIGITVWVTKREGTT